MVNTFRTDPMAYSAENREPQTSVWTLNSRAQGLPLTSSQVLGKGLSDRTHGDARLLRSAVPGPRSWRRLLTVLIHPKTHWPSGVAVGPPYRAGAEEPGLSFLGWTHCDSLPNHLDMSKCMSA